MKKTRKISKVARERVYMVRTALVLVSIAMLFAIGGGILSIKNQMSTRTYTSDFMKMQFDYPTKFSIQADLTSVSLSIKGNEGRISISKYGTNYTDVVDHVNNAMSHWKQKPEAISFFEGDSTNGMVVSGGDKNETYRIYYFVKNFALYQFEANDPSLFSDLDAIAKSFRILE